MRSSFSATHIHTYVDLKDVEIKQLDAEKSRNPRAALFKAIIYLFGMDHGLPLSIQRAKKELAPFAGEISIIEGTPPPAAHLTGKTLSVLAGMSPPAEISLPAGRSTAVRDLLDGIPSPGESNFFLAGSPPFLGSDAPVKADPLCAAMYAILHIAFLTPNSRKRLLQEAGLIIGPHIADVLELARDGDHYALVIGAKALSLGLGVSRPDPGQAEIYFRQAITSIYTDARGNTFSQDAFATHFLGLHLKNASSRLGRANARKAADLLREATALFAVAADGGHVAAQYEVGDSYTRVLQDDLKPYPNNVAESREQVFIWAEENFLSAISQGQESVKPRLAELYKKQAALGEKEQDYDKAETLYRKLSGLGDPEYVISLALFYNRRQRYGEAQTLFLQLVSTDLSKIDKADYNRIKGVIVQASIVIAARCAHGKPGVAIDYEESFRACTGVLGDPDVNLPPHVRNELTVIYHSVVAEGWVRDRRGSIRHAQLEDVALNSDTILFLDAEDHAKATTWLRAEAAKPDVEMSADLAAELGRRVAGAIGCQADPEAAYDHYLYAARHGSISGMLAMAECSYRSMLDQSRNWGEALRWCRFIRESEQEKPDEAQLQRVQAIEADIHAQATGENARFWVAGPQGLRPAVPGDDFETAHIVPSDPEAAFIWYKTAALEGSAAALEKALELSRKTGKEADTLELLKIKALAGDVDAALDMAARHARGIAGRDPDDAEALVWYRCAADLGSIPAMPEVIERVYRGTGCSEDWAEALRLCRELSTPERRKDLSGLQREKITVIETDIQAHATGENARLWVEGPNGLRPAVDGDDLEKALTVPSNETAALAWYEAAVGKGSAPAALMAAELHGKAGKETDAFEILYLLASEKYDAAVELELARRFAGGLGCGAENLIEALRRCRTLEDKGNLSEAQQAILEVLRTGILSETEDKPPTIWVPDAQGGALRPATKEDGLAALKNAVCAPDDPEAALAWYEGTAREGSAPAALTAARLYSAAEREPEAFDMLCLAAIDLQDWTAGLKLVEYFYEEKEEATNLDHAFALCMALVKKPDNFVSEDQKERARTLHKLILEEAWVEVAGETLRRVRGGAAPDIEIDAANEQDVVFLPPDGAGIEKLLDYEDTSIDAAAELALRIKEGPRAGVTRNDTEALRRMSRLLYTFQVMPPPEESLGIVPADSRLRIRLQEAWDDLAGRVTSSGMSDSVEYNVRGAPEGTEPYRISASDSREFARLIVEGRQRATARAQQG